MAGEYYVNGKQVSKAEYDRVKKSMKVFPVSNSDTNNSTTNSSGSSNTNSNSETAGGLDAADDPEAQVFINDSPQIVNKTDKASNKPNSVSTVKTTGTSESKFSKQSKQIVEKTGIKNVLNGYRSVTYNFTFAGLKKDYLDNPEDLRSSDLDLVILKSGGKGTNGISAIGTPADDLIQGFNKNSPGRFDMFIDDVEIESLMAFSPASNTSMPTKIKFDVIEPYSINGFIEALHVSAIAAGYTNYLTASFVLKVEFKGYPDNIDFSQPVTIPNTTRYFPIGITAIDVDISEQGTRYKVSAVPFNERSFGNQNVIKKSIKMQGNTVKEILTNLIDVVNKQNIKSYLDSKPNGNVNQVDTYDIKFPSWSDSTGLLDSQDNKISSAILVELLKDNALYSMVDPANSTKPDAYKSSNNKQPSPQTTAKAPESIKYNPTTTTVQFSENMNIHDIIIAVIRDSEYTRNIIKDIKTHTDPYGMVDYFMVRLEVSNTGVNNEETKKPVQKLTYVVTPYKIHFSKIPNLSDNLIKEEELKKLSVREYNYIYTGQNTDVLSFRLNFNSLFFEAVPVSMGKKDVPEAKTSAANDNNIKLTQSSPSNDDLKKLQVPGIPKRTNVTPIQYYGANAAQPLDDPYSILARNMHDSVVNSKASMLTGEMEILGDPFYLVTGGLGNYRPKPLGKSKTATGEADHLYGQLMISINFRNPEDIMTFEQGGRVFFDPNRVPFSGVYQVISVRNSFKSGVFKQTLSVLRMPGQILDQSVAPTDITKSIRSQPDSYSVKKQDSTRAAAPSQRIDTPTSLAQLERGLPSPGLPGKLSNFTNATGGLGGTNSDLMNRTYGLVGRDGNLFSGVTASTPLPTDVSSNIRLNSSGIFDINNSNLNTAALAAVASNVITGNVPFKRAIGVVAGGIASNAVSSLLNRSNVGSGIGEGASVEIDEVTISDADATMNDIRSGNLINDVSLPTGSINEFTSAIGNLGTNAVNAVTGIGEGIGKFVNNVGDKIKSLSSTPADPDGQAAALGINPSAISGLSPKLQSKVLSEAQSLANSIPGDVDLRQAVNTGLVLDYIPKDKISNIPATPPYSTAPDPVSDSDITYINSVVSNKGVSALEDLYGVNDVRKLSSNLVPDSVLSQAINKVPNVEINPFRNITPQANNVDASVLKDKFATVNSQISSLTGLLNIKDTFSKSSVGGSLGSLSSGQSPLDKLVNKLGDPNSQPYTGDDPIIRSRLGLPPKG